ncbi:(Na+)-NQR maturation NqrM [Spongiibacter taiwanensis]|uniref:(Na+)-NQR maturation NqrM n=1 Tax=Spongiibacter taiwanensis TaxID=1748242 RepID=UPI002035B00A|nr:(Na+)-NQR maturation NqrM [Spongiibacter taiwanensis]USA43523.1 (Na+)-NQR maturation NqrM [Spongiibacter taiwanensis]
MLATIIAAAIFLMLVMAAMSIGVLLGRKPIAGSCGGVGAAMNDPDYVCDLCGNDPNKCEERSQTAASSAKKGGVEFYNADK